MSRSGGAGVRSEASMVLRGASLPARPGRWDIAISGAQVVAVEPHAASGASMGGESLDGQLVSRPFVDPHLHLDKAFQNGLLTNQTGSLEEAIRLGRQLGERMQTQDQLVGRILRGAMAALGRGTTVLRSHIDVDPIVGLRGVEAALIARSMLPAHVRLELVAFPQHGIDDVVLSLLRKSLDLGCEAVGGIPAQQPDPRSHIQQVFDLAVDYDVPVDMHVDESDDPNDRTLTLVAEETMRRGWHHRVIASHCCSLSAQPLAVRGAVIEQVHDAGIHVVTLPSTNLYLQGRSDVHPRRGLTPVRELLARGVNVAYGSDNIQDVFNPFGNASMVESGLLLAHAAHMGTADQLGEIFEMATLRPAAALAGQAWIGSRKQHVAPGMVADLLVFPVPTVQDVIVQQVHPALVYLAGAPVVRRREEVRVLTGSVQHRVPDALASES